MSRSSSPAQAEAEKRAAGHAAVSEVRSGMLLGLGTGSTVRYFLEGLTEAIESGRLRDVRGVPTSSWTETRCRELRIPMASLTEGTALDLVVDGADEVAPGLDLVKGLGGALLREKMVAQAGKRLVIIVDSGKEVRVLGERAPVPVEVTRFGWRAHLPLFRSLGAEPRVRRRSGGEMTVTDNGNYLIDLNFKAGVDVPGVLHEALARQAGIIETGLFLGMADRVIVGTAEGVRIRERDGDG